MGSINQLIAGGHHPERLATFFDGLLIIISL